MHAFEIQYLVFGGFNIVACVIMMVTYTITNPWWRTHLGRMMMTYAAAEGIMAALLMSTVVFHFAPHWFRAVWFVLQSIVGLTFCYQTSTILKLHRQRVREAQHERVA
jgi:hypothetical protein